jgi:hypothetical protein
LPAWLPACSATKDLALLVAQQQAAKLAEANKKRGKIAMPQASSMLQLLQPPSHCVSCILYCMHIRYLARKPGGWKARALESEDGGLEAA